MPTCYSDNSKISVVEALFNYRKEHLGNSPDMIFMSFPFARTINPNDFIGVSQGNNITIPYFSGIPVAFYNSNEKEFFLGEKGNINVYNNYLTIERRL